MAADRGNSLAVSLPFGHFEQASHRIQLHPTIAIRELYGFTIPARMECLCVSSCPRLFSPAFNQLWTESCHCQLA